LLINKYIYENTRRYTYLCSIKKQDAFFTSIKSKNQTYESNSSPIKCIVVARYYTALCTKPCSYKYQRYCSRYQLYSFGGCHSNVTFSFRFILVNFGNANDKGVFEFRNVKNIPYLLKISYVGFLPYQQHLIASATAVNDLGVIKIKPISQELLEVVVKTAKAPLSIKGDTIEYNAASFKVPPGSTVEDLLRKLPGIEVDGSGNIKAQGNDVKK
jgi:hypothetical protein